MLKEAVIVVPQHFSTSRSRFSAGKNSGFSSPILAQEQIVTRRYFSTQFKFLVDSKWQGSFFENGYQK